MRFVTVTLLLFLWSSSVRCCVEMEKNPCEKPEDNPLFHLNHGAMTIGAGLAEMLTGMTPDASNFSPQIDPLMPPPAPAPMPMAAAHKTHKRIRRAISVNQLYRPSSLPYNLLGLGDAYPRKPNGYIFTNENEDKATNYYFKEFRHPFFPPRLPYNPADPCDVNYGYPKNDQEWLRRYRIRSACQNSLRTRAASVTPMAAPSSPPQYRYNAPVAPPVLPIRPDYFQNPPSQTGFYVNPAAAYPAVPVRGPTPPAPPKSEQRQICYDQYGRYTDCDDIQYQSFAKPEVYPNVEKNSIVEGDIIQGYAQPAAGVSRLQPIQAPARPKFDLEDTKEFNDKDNGVEDTEAATLPSRRRN